jgi:hypothetical protein
MRQNHSLPVLQPSQSTILPESCVSLTILRHQTLARTGDLQSHVEPVSWDFQGQDVFLSQILCTAMIIALDAYTALMAERLAV